MKLLLMWMGSVLILLGILELYARVTSFDVKGEYFMAFFWILIISGIVTIFGVLLTPNKDKDDKQWNNRRTY